MDTSPPPPPAISAATADELASLAAALDRTPLDQREDKARDALPLISGVLEELNGRARRSGDTYDVSFASAAKSVFQPLGDALRAGFPAAYHTTRAARELSAHLRRHPDCQPMNLGTPFRHGF